MPVSQHRWWLGSAVAIALVMAIGCGGGGGDDDDDDPSPTCVSFVGAASPAPSTVVARQDSASSCDQVVVEFAATDIADLYAVGADVTYDPAVVDFEAVSVTGSVLADGGVTLSTLVEERVPGTVTVGVSRTGAPTGVDVTGTSRVFRMTFRKVADSGAGTLTPSYEVVQNSGDGTGPEPIPGVVWSGGTFRVQ